MKRLRVLAVLAVLAGGAAFRAFDACWPPPVAELEAPRGSRVVTAADGTPMRVALTARGERWLPLADGGVSPWLLRAAVAAEDRRFFGHDGVDLRGVLRALLANLRHGGIREGASTITMQLARQLEDLPRTLAGKLAQVVRARQLERRFDKETLLLAYLDRVPLGGNLRGVGAAAHAWFGRRAADLDAAESALLVSMLPSPSRYRPDRDPEGARARRDAVLEAMHAEGYLDDAQVARASAAPLRLSPTPFPDVAPHAWQRVREGRTTIDPAVQDAVEDLAGRAGGVDGLAIVVVDNETRGIVALAGARRPSPRVLDATGRPRSLGSTLKPLLYAAAFDAGLAMPGTPLPDLPWEAADWAPRDFDRRTRGPVPAGEALAESLNLPAVRLAAALGPGRFRAVLERAGFRHLPSAAGADLAIGTTDGTAIELAAAYAALARDGAWSPVGVTEGPREVRRVVSAGAAQLVTEILADPCRARPPGAPRHGVAWKTGTSSRRRDAWTAGYTRRFTVVVWRGRLDGAPAPGLVGADAAAPLFFDVLRVVDPDPPPFDPPAAVEHVEACAVSGLAADAGCRDRVADRTPAGVRVVACGVHRRLCFDARTGALRCVRCRAGHEVVERVVAVFEPRVAAWRRAHGWPVDAVAPHARDCPAPLEPDGLAPWFVEPADGRRFAAGADGRARVDVRVLALDPASPVRLLVDGAEAGPVLRLPAGEHRVVAVDGAGRSAALRVVVAMRE